MILYLYCSIIWKLKVFIQFFNKISIFRMVFLLHWFLNHLINVTSHRFQQINKNIDRPWETCQIYDSIFGSWKYFAIQKSKKNISSRCKYEKSCSSFSPFKDILSNISASYAFGNALRKIPHMACRHQIYLMHLSFDNLALHHVWITQNHVEYNSFLLLIR